MCYINLRHTDGEQEPINKGNDPVRMGVDQSQVEMNWQSNVNSVKLNLFGGTTAFCDDFLTPSPYGTTLIVSDLNMNCNSAALAGVSF